MSVKSLKDLDLNESATITFLRGSSLFTETLTQMGFFANTKIEKIKTTHYGDPSFYKIHNKTIALKDKDAEWIFVV